MADISARSRQPLSAMARLLASFSRQGRTLFDRIAPYGGITARSASRAASSCETLRLLVSALLSVRGEASGVAIAQDLLALYKKCPDEERRRFFIDLAERFDPDPATLKRAWESYLGEGTKALPRLAQAVESPRQELFRRLNSAPGGTEALVRMRADLLRYCESADGQLDRVDADLAHLLQSWFNRGFLMMTPITWRSPARLLESVIRFEAVHDIHGWDDLRRRLDPGDRRCFAFFHPVMPDEPLIFVEVALTEGISGNIQEVLADDRTALAPEQADTAIFYSISNCQEGLRGISFGHFLIKQVAADLKKDLPNLTSFVTLSPIPGFLGWLRKSKDAKLAKLDAEQWWSGPEAEALRSWLMSRAVEYFRNTKDRKGRPLDPVARFHLGNGARLERVNWLADISAKGLRQSAGLMVNYLYDLPRIEENHEAYAESSRVITGEPFQKLERAVEKAAAAVRRPGRKAA